MENYFDLFRSTKRSTQYRLINTIFHVIYPVKNV
jgi:hypothetical protein